MSDQKEVNKKKDEALDYEDYRRLIAERLRSAREAAGNR